MFNGLRSLYQIFFVLGNLAQNTYLDIFLLLMKAKKMNYYINWGTEAEFPFLRNFGESQFRAYFFLKSVLKSVCGLVQCIIVKYY